MRIENDLKLGFKDVMLRPKRSTLESRKQVSLERKYKFRNFEPYDLIDVIDDCHYNGIPIMASNMDGVGTFEMADTLGIAGGFTCLVKTYSVMELVNFFDDPKHPFRHTFTAYSMGITDADHMKFREVYEQAPDIKYVCIDVANGYTERFVEFVKTFRQLYSNIVIIAGNVVTAEMTEELLLAGADIVKVGIGPGSVCTTRIQTGVGYPQLSAVIECADAAHGLGGHIIADGGCTTPGDVAKAFAGGADFVMLGGMLAGHDEGGGEIITKGYWTNEVSLEQGGFGQKMETKSFVQFYGMSSKEANEKHFGGLKDYRSAEGKSIQVPYRGPVLDTFQNICGGLRSSCTYIGAQSLKQISKCATFVRVAEQENQIFN